MSDYNKIWVVSESAQDYSALCAVASTLGGSSQAHITALWIGNASEAQALGASGAHVVALVDDAQSAFETKGASIAQVIASHEPEVVLCATSKRTRLLAAQIAAKLQTRVLNDVSALENMSEGLIAEHMVYGGSALRKEKVKETPAVILASESFLLTQDTSGVSAQNAEVTPLACEATPGIELVATSPREVESVNLTGAQNVVSVGRGFENEEDLNLAYALATAVGGETGCTRPIAEGVCWMSNERYIGVSGAMLKPNLFIAIGLSGQVQHMVGANRAKTIVAINKDKNAPIFKQADYGIVGDLYDVLPKLTEALK